MQNQFIKNVKHYFKQEGEAWLERLPEIIHQCEQKWRVTMEEPYSLSVNYAAPAKLNDRTQVVVKISIPGEEFSRELEALKLLQSQSMVELLDVDQELGAFLLERIIPGDSLADIEDEEKACRTAARVFRQLTAESPERVQLPTTEEREKSLAKIIDNHPEGCGPISRSTLLEAKRVFRHLHSTSRKKWVLHGDFHHYNILRDGDSTWKVIDPKGLIGEREYDLIQFLLNKLPDENPVTVMGNRIEIFTKTLQLDRERFLLWGFCHSVLAACWTVEDDGSYHRPFYQAIAAFQQLYKQQFHHDISEVAFG